MSKIPEKIIELSEALNKLSGTNTFENAKDTVNSLIQLLGIEDEPVWRTFTDTNGRIVSNGAWLKKAEGFADRRGAYKLNIDEKFNIDLKAYWVNKKIDKSKISMLVALTPNFEDEPFYSSKNIGIDFIIPEVPDRITVVLSKNYIIRTVELHESLSVTQQEIFAKWLKINDFSNKSKLHELLWQSFDLEPVNKQFYKGICEFFTELKQHLVSEDVFDARHAAYFTNRLIGRIVFCRFLDKKGIINPVMKYFETEDKDSTEYYKDKLETLFFNVFNTPIDDRQVGSDDKTPFLNGGLFEIKENDKYQDDKLTFPTDYFARLFDFLKHYNFTTDESTSSFQQVAIDPEMLGKIFENLLAEQVEETGQQARKAKGAFYTPREIVDYMCKESLREYLKTKVTEARDRDDKISLLLDTKPHLWRDQQRNYVKDLEPFKIEIFKALDSVKILDPACGSGAFPMGMMQLLLMCYERLEPRFDPYSTKLSIIKNNLYGVDIEPMAVEISRLRAWLSIIVDKEGDIRKIEPLPNLDFKFVCANSLIPLDVHQNLTDDSNLDIEIARIRDEYYDEKTIKNKIRLRGKFQELILPKETQFEKSNKQEQLESYHPFDTENICKFFDPIFMFGFEKFDILIGNPPYVVSKKSDFKHFDWQGDLYTIFFELSLKKLLKKHGVISFITPIFFLYNKNNTQMRKYLIDEASIKSMIICNPFDAVTENIISVIKNSQDTVNTIEFFNYSGNKFVHINSYLKEWVRDNNHYEISPFLTVEISLLLKKISRNCIELGDITISKRGAEIGKSDLKSTKIGEPILIGYDVSKYSISKTEAKISRNHKEFKRLKQVFAQTNIILLRRVSKILIATVLKNKFAFSKNLYAIIPNNINESNYICSLLNSKLFNFYYRNKFSMKKEDTFPEIQTYLFEQLPVKNVNSKNSHIKNRLIELVEEMLNLKNIEPEVDTANIENNIDLMVYKLYELTYDEIKIIEPEIEKIISQAEYEKMEIE